MIVEFNKGIASWSERETTANEREYRYRECERLDQVDDDCRWDREYGVYYRSVGCR